ncbi:MAG: erythromycin esterase family protein [Bacteroidetes bacterium]|nr:erythromycin esterase family protein [Bacteroidota bacterium]
MKNYRLYALFITFLFVGACSTDDIVDPGPVVLSDAQQLRVDELNDIIHELNETDPDSPFAELEGLAGLGEARIVGLGEATHGTREFFQFKDRLFRYLVEEHDFNVFGFEADFSEALFFEEYITGTDHDLDALMEDKMIFWTWQTEEVKAVFEWMRAYNDGKAPAEQIHYFGFDCQTPRLNVDALVDRLEPLDASFADSVAYRMYNIRRLTEIDPLDEDDWADEYGNFQWVKDEIESRTPAFLQVISEKEMDLINRILRVVEQCMDVQYAYQYNGSDNPRDPYMAENALWILEYLGQDIKMAAWAHNLHVHKTEAWEAFGSVLRDALGADYQAVGFGFSQGWFRAYFPGASVKLQKIDSEPIAGSYNEVFHHAKYSDFYFRFDDFPGESSWINWMFENPMFMQFGSTFNGNASNYYNPVNLGQWFDVMVYIDQTEASQSL